MKNKYFNKLSFRDKINNYRQSARFVINQPQQQPAPQLVLFSQSNLNPLHSANPLVPESQICMTQLHRVNHSKQIDHRCKSCERKKESNMKASHFLMKNTKIISPKIIEILLDKKDDTCISNKNNSIHSYNEYSKLQMSEREKFKQYQLLSNSNPRNISRSVSSRITSKSRASKANISEIINSQYNINSKQGMSKSKTYNRIFKKSSSFNNVELNVRGIFPLPLQSTYGRR